MEILKSPSKPVRYLLLVCLTLSASYFLHDAIPTVAGYYMYDYAGVTTGVVVDSRLDNDGPYEVVYQYQVGGEIYSSKLVNHSINNRSVASETVQKYPLAQEVTVYYELAKPDEAVLERTSPGSWLWGQIVAVLFIFGLAVHYFVIEKIFGDIDSDDFPEAEEFADSGDYPFDREKHEKHHRLRSRALYLIIAGAVLSMVILELFPDNETALGVVSLIAAIVLFVIWREMRTRGFYIDTEIGDGTREGSPIIHSIYLLTFMALSVTAFVYGAYILIA